MFGLGKSSKIFAQSLYFIIHGPLQGAKRAEFTPNTPNGTLPSGLHGYT